ncbi:MAG TPA: TetR/AcrR family transcriptional regulator [Verrucomicrobiae bacterium]|nr:TetR/AcrR family transcriptional regulator [Verrucomicrobiae bacterium]
MGRVSDAKERLMRSLTELIWTGSYGSTTIDQICERAGVKKGSFYYFFDSKAALAEEAMRTGWEDYRVNFDRVFSPALPPLDRIHRYCEFEYEEQAKIKREHGHVLGCPLCTLGSEISTLETNLRKMVDEIMDQCRRYFETAIRDAHAAKLIVAPDAVCKSKLVYAYVEGLLTQARIRDDLELLKDMERGILDILGANVPVAA